MTLEEFDNTKFASGDKAIYLECERIIRTVDFTERLIGLINEVQILEIYWVRCENIEYIPLPVINPNQLDLF